MQREEVEQRVQLLWDALPLSRAGSLSPSQAGLQRTAGVSVWTQGVLKSQCIPTDYFFKLLPMLKFQSALNQSGRRTWVRSTCQQSTIKWKIKYHGCFKKHKHGYMHKNIWGKTTLNRGLGEKVDSEIKSQQVPRHSLWDHSKFLQQALAWRWSSKIQMLTSISQGTGVESWGLWGWLGHKVKPWWLRITYEKVLQGALLLNIEHSKRPPGRTAICHLPLHPLEQSHTWL